jgi:hypothetical protein
VGLIFSRSSFSSLDFISCFQLPLIWKFYFNGPFLCLVTLAVIYLINLLCNQRNNLLCEQSNMISIIVITRLNFI